VSVYRACWWVALGLSKLLFRLQVQGREHIPSSGGLVVASNHASYVDPPLIGVAAGRELYYVTKAEVFPVPFLGWLIRQLNAMPIDRSKGDRGALLAYETRLLCGGAVFIAPEGTRNKGKRFLPPKPGAGMLVYRAGVPVVPVYVAGTRSVLMALLGLERITVRFGRAVRYPAQRLPERRKEAYEAISADIMKRIGALKHARPNAGTALPASFT
jgi:1-acyl-sn-glycerol-3-phosphate acyltransferase